ncbi:MAG: tRNA (N(6)-L-threonylcarbamoyladenosine(37)-C(2))-methylthiotransferase MtaB [Candidatus Omnitrophota bacterium]
MPDKTISLHTIGCRTNQAESAALRTGFERAGHLITDTEPGDIAVINTCTVTHKSEADCRRLINRLRRQNPDIRIALTGCQAQLHAEELKDIPNVCWIVSNPDKFALVDIITRCEESAIPARKNEYTPHFTHPYPAIDPAHTRANLKIQDGCDEFCAYCEVPFARGRVRSREFNDILREADELAGAGYKEIILTGIHVGKYRHNGNTLIDVIKALEDMENIQRIRLSSIEPTEILEELIRHMAGQSKLCRYLHIPLQHGSDDILKAMGRKYTAAEFSRTVRRAAETVTDICIGTDVIVGFPGERDQHFKSMYDLLSELPVHYFHVFSYSDRPNARARNLSNRVNDFVKFTRSRKLRALSRNKRTAFYRNFIGRTVDVLFEQQKDGQWKGLTDNFLSIAVHSEQDLSNTVQAVRINRLRDDSILQGDIVYSK